MSFLKSLYAVLELSSEEEPAPKRARSDQGVSAAPLYLNRLEDSVEAESHLDAESFCMHVYALVSRVDPPHGMVQGGGLIPRQGQGRSCHLR